MGFSADRFARHVAVTLWLALGLACWPALAAAEAPADCQRESPAARDGERPPESLLHQLVRCHWERTARPEWPDQGRVLVSIESLQLGPARRWGEPTDYGEAYLGTRVWPVTVRYVRHEHSVGHVEQVRGEGVFNCFVNVKRRWHCTYAYALTADAAAPALADGSR